MSQAAQSYPDRGQPPPVMSPANIEAEQALLGALLFSNASLESVGHFLKARHFIEPVHGRMYDAIAAILSAPGGAADPMLVAAKMRGDQAFDELGGASYLAALMDLAPPGQNAPDYAKVIFDLAIRRDLVGILAIGTKAATTANDGTAFDVVSELRRHIEAIEHDAAPDDASMVDAPDAAATAIAQMEDMAVNGRTRGMLTGLRCMDRRLNGLKGGALLVIGGRPGMGKAQPLDAGVLLADGRFLAMGSVRVGDQLASVDGEPSSVTGVFPQGEKDIYRVTLSDGRSAEVCAEHLWLVRYRSWPEPKVLDTATIASMLERARYRNRLSIDPHTGDFGQNRELPLDPWVLGALIGDGKLSDATPSFTTADPEVVAEMSRRVAPDMEVAAAWDDITYRVRTVGGSARPGVQGMVPNRVSEALRVMRLHGCRSEDKFIPPEYFEACRPARMALLRGLLDTDGWVEAFGSVRFCTTSPRLARDVATLVWSLGGRASTSTRQPTYTHKGEKRSGLLAYVLNIQGLAGDDLFTIARKRDRVKPMREARLSIASVRLSRRAQAQCISVSHPRRLYITDDYVVTHNTALARATAHGAAVRNPNKLILFVGIEMGPEEMMQREISALTHEFADGIEYRAMASGALTPMDFMAIRDVEGRVPPNLILSDSPAVSVDDVRRKIWALSRRGKVGAVFIDYLQLMRRPAANGRNEASVVAEMTQALKQLARQADVCIVLLSQLNRSVESRDDKKPQLSDLRESGSIEQDADAVLFPFREHYYLVKAEPKAGGDKHLEWEMRCQDTLRQLEVICAKQRQGPEGTDRQRYFAEFDFIEDDHDHA